MPIAVEPLVSIVRWYDGPYTPHRSPYVAICTLLWESPTVVTIVGLHGTVTRAMREELRQALADAGVTTVHAERHGHERAWSVRGHVESGGTGGDGVQN